MKGKKYVSLVGQSKSPLPFLIHKATKHCQQFRVHFRLAVLQQVRPLHQVHLSLSKM